MCDQRITLVMNLRSLRVFIAAYLTLCLPGCNADAIYLAKACCAELGSFSCLKQGKLQIKTYIYVRI